MWITSFVETTLSLIVGCVLGVCGIAQTVDTTGPGAVFIIYSQGGGGITIGEVSFSSPLSKHHEQGHVMWYREMGSIGLPFAAIGSLIGYLTADSYEAYHEIYTERIADELGGIHR